MNSTFTNFIAVSIILSLLVVIAKILFKKLPVIIAYIPSIIFAGAGVYIIGRFLYLTWSGAAAACNPDSGCLNEDWSILFGVFMLFVAAFAAMIAKFFTKPKNELEF